MTAAAAAARVWITAAGAVAGTILASHHFDPRLSVASATLGAIGIAVRRRRVVAGIALFVLVTGLAALQPMAVNEESEFSRRGLPARFRSALEDALTEVDDRPAALISGLTIGDTSGIDYGTTETFRRSGLAHLVAVSGSNVAIVLGALAVVTSGLPLVMRAAVALAGLGVYVAIVGPEPSVLRAAAMGIVAVVAYVAGRPTAPLNSLGIALTGVLAVKPDLLFEIGLHLSAAATFGIVVWARPLAGYLHRLPAVLRAPVAITLAAQIAVAPLVIATFERVSLVAPIANVLAAPAVAPATVLGLGAGIVATVAPGAGRFVGWIAAPFAQWILWVAETTGGWSWAAADAPAWFGWAVGVPVAGIALASAVRAARR